MKMKTRLRQALAFFFREYDFRRRGIMWQLVWLFYDLMWAISVGFLGVGAATVTGANIDSEHLVLYLMIGTFIWTYLSSIFHIVSWAITWERWEGTIEYTFMAPVSRMVHLFGNSLFALLYGLIRMIIVFTVAMVIFDVSLANTNFVAAGIILALASVSFVGLGMIAAVLPLIDPEQGAKAPLFIEAVVMMVSGIFYPIAVLPVWLQHVSKVSPATYALEGMRKAIIEGLPVSQLWGFVWPLVLIGIVLIPTGALIFSMGERYAKRTGKLKRRG
jgi:ABC-2 type transport system permease protein